MHMCMYGFFLRMEICICRCVSTLLIIRVLWVALFILFQVFSLAGTLDRKEEERIPRRTIGHCEE